MCNRNSEALSFHYLLIMLHKKHHTEYISLGCGKTRDLTPYLKPEERGKMGRGKEKWRKMGKYWTVTLQ
jgi:hypothetical protein